MSVQDSSTAFHSLAARLPDWPESSLIDYYRDGLNVETMGEVIEHANPCRVDTNSG